MREGSSHLVSAAWHPMKQPMQQPVLAMPSGFVSAGCDRRISTGRPNPVAEVPTPSRNTLLTISSTAPPGPMSPVPALEFRMKSIAGGELGSEICPRISAFKKDEVSPRTRPPSRPPQAHHVSARARTTARTPNVLPVPRAAAGLVAPADACGLRASAHVRPRVAWPRALR